MTLQSFHYNMKLAAFGRGGLLKPMEAVIQEMETAQACTALRRLTASNLEVQMVPCSPVL